MLLDTETERSLLSSPPAASVLLPVYNGGRYLARAVESVLNQTFQHFEVLLLNDGSTDNSLQILESFASIDGRCRIYDWPNRGLIATLNAGLELAQGEFIIRMDADDVCRPQRFEKQISWLRLNAEYVAVGASTLFIDADGMPIFEVVDRYTHEEIERALLSRRLGIAHPSAIIRRSSLEAIGGYRPGYPHAEDLDLFLRLAEVGRLANLPDVLLDYRQHVASVSYQYVIEQSASARNAVSDACKRRSIAWDDVERNLAPPPRSQTRSDVHRKWAWWALGAGNLPTAKKHALHALKHGPLNLENWRLAACVLRGY